jgi:hypothetical protein
MVPFVQVLYGQPLWNVARGGCINLSDTYLRHGQAQLGIAFWIWLSIWIWWGWERLDMSAIAHAAKRSIKRISPVAKCILASIGSIPFVFGSWIMIQVGLEDLADIPIDPSIDFGISALLAIAIWIAIWWRRIIWTPTVAFSTSVLAFTCFGVPVAAQAMFLAENEETIAGFVLFALPLLGWGAWMAIAIRLWPMRSLPGDDRVTPQCLRCGYLLTGLTITRCPECGDEPTLDQLWNGNAGPL